MGNILIEASSPLGHEIEGPGHLYLVYGSDNLTKFVIRGGPENDIDIFDGSFSFGNIAVEVNMPMEISEDSRPLDQAGSYGSREIDLGGAEDVWFSMVKTAAQINQSGINYDVANFLFWENRNTVIDYVLTQENIDLSENMLLNPNEAGEYLLFGAYLGAGGETYYENIDDAILKKSSLIE